MALQKEYVVGKYYIDKAGKSEAGDQFTSWFNIPGSSCNNSSGIRAFKYICKNRYSLPAYIVLVTSQHKSASSYHNPWEDTIDLKAGKIIYWGDAKAGKKSYEEYKGNTELLKVWKALQQGTINLSQIPPILHFSKPKPGVSCFNGLCRITELEVMWMNDNNTQLQNVRLTLKITEIKRVPLSWLHARCTGSITMNTDQELEKNWYSINQAYEYSVRKTSTVATINARVGQGLFREKLLKYWDYKCTVTKCDLEQILIASHIKPWRLSTDTERLDVFNAFLLIPNLDTLFDQGLISFTNLGKMVLSRFLGETNIYKLGLSKDMVISELNERHLGYLDFHRKHIFRY